MKKAKTKVQEFICVICKDLSVGYGNNPQPINEGVCCDSCNAHYVLPARMKQIIKIQNLK